MSQVPRLILALQSSPKDIDDAIELVRLICDIEPVRRNDVEFWIAYRRDCAPHKIQKITALLSAKFGIVSGYRAANYSDGWPSGPNSLWTSLMIEASVRATNRRIGQFDGILTFEPDCVPTQRSWINQLRWLWSKTLSSGKLVVGHLHPPVGRIPIHINGNAIFWVNTVKRNPSLMLTGSELAHDIKHASWNVLHGMDTPLITQMYGYKNLSAREWINLSKHGARPALLHGIKDDSARTLARIALVPDVLGRYSSLATSTD